MKLIFIGNSLPDIKKIKEFATQNQYTVQIVSEESWKKKSISSQEASGSRSKKKRISNGWKGYNIFQSIDETKRQAIQNGLIMCRGNVTKASKILHVGRATLYRLIDQFEINLSSMRFPNEEELSTRFKQWKKSA